MYFRESISYIKKIMKLIPHSEYRKIEIDVKNSECKILVVTNENKTFCLL